MARFPCGCLPAPGGLILFPSGFSGPPSLPALLAASAVNPRNVADVSSTEPVLEEPLQRKSSAKTMLKRRAIFSGVLQRPFSPFDESHSFLRLSRQSEGRPI